MSFEGRGPDRPGEVQRLDRPAAGREGPGPASHQGHPELPRRGPPLRLPGRPHDRRRRPSSAPGRTATPADPGIVFIGRNLNRPQLPPRLRSVRRGVRRPPAKPSPGLGPGIRVIPLAAACPRRGTPPTQRDWPGVRRFAASRVKRRHDGGRVGLSMSGHRRLRARLPRRHAGAQRLRRGRRLVRRHPGLRARRRHGPSRQLGPHAEAHDGRHPRPRRHARPGSSLAGTTAPSAASACDGAGRDDRRIRAEMGRTGRRLTAPRWPVPSARRRMSSTAASRS